MKKISDDKLLNYYFNKYNIAEIFDYKIINYAQLHFYEKGEFIMKSEAQLEYYYLLVAGKVQVYYLFENGKSMMLKFYTNFSSIGDLELLKDMPVSCNVEVLMDSYLIALPAPILRKDYIDNPNFLRYLVNCLSEKLDATISNISYNYTYPLINRLASYLIEHISDNDCIILTSSFKEISLFLGTTYRHLNRTFRELEAKSIISCDNKVITIIDKDELNKLAKNFYKKEKS